MANLPNLRVGAVVFAFCALALGGCNARGRDDGKLAPTSGAPTGGIPAVGDISPTTADGMPALCTGRKMIFLDNFDGASLDRSKWHTSTPDDGCSLIGNKEKQCYTEQQVTVHDGALHLIAVKRSTDGEVATFDTGSLVVKTLTFPFASGMVHTSHAPDPSQKIKGTPGLFAFQYGYFEARLKIPAGRGLWPAFWTVAADGQWPPEIDAMEFLADNPSLWRGNYHWRESGQEKKDLSEWSGPDFSKDFHTIGVDWQPAAITWYIDGVVRKTFTDAKNITSSPQNLILNLAVGGWAGDPDSATVFPAELLVDRVLVCK